MIQTGLLHQALCGSALLAVYHVTLGVGLYKTKCSAGLKQTFGIPIRIRRKTVVLKKSPIDITYVVFLQGQKCFLGHDTRLLRASHNLVLCTTQEIENKRDVGL